MTRIVNALPILLLLAFGAAAVSATPMHFDLDRSVPEAGATVAPPSTVTLWFTQVPQENSSSTPRSVVLSSTTPSSVASSALAR